MIITHCESTHWLPYFVNHTAISRKVVGENVHTTSMKGNMGYDQYTVPDSVAVEPTFVSVSFSTRKHTSIVARAILSNFCEDQLTQNLPQYLSGLSRALYPTTSLELAVFKFTNISLLNQQ